jgi:glycosyltransferase involved in cell wall biosynthesis
MKLSAVVLAGNEERNISRCIKSLKFCNEILVIDDFSTDKTVEIAKKLGAKVLKRKLKGDFATQRNFALRQAQGDWILFVDADEIVEKDLANEIIQAANDSDHKYSGFYIKREDKLWGKKLKYGETGTIKILRLAKRGAGRWKRKVHEYWDVEGKLGVLKNPLTHFTHPTLSEFLYSVNWMSSLHAKSNSDEGKPSNLIKIVLWPSFKFMVNYIFKLGFLDGVEGFISALIMSFHSYLAWSKLWIMQKRKL